jgi:Ca-activated chloride channel family protein
MKTNFLISLLFLLSAFYALPDRRITGTITDKTLQPLPGITITVKGTNNSSITDQNGKYSILAPITARFLLYSGVGYKTAEKRITSDTIINVCLSDDVQSLGEVVVTGFGARVKKSYVAAVFANNMGVPATMPAYTYGPKLTTENYSPVNENGFQIASQSPVTTFSADVDRASYSNIRRVLNAGNMPPADAVRIEEMVNYFEYNYPEPTGSDPILATTELTDSPWNKGLKLLHIGLQARRISMEKLPASNLVFLIDVSGSMFPENKLPLLKQAFKLLVDQLREQDKVSIVVYAGAAGVALPATSGKEKIKIKEALDNLEAGGSTAGGEGINLAYKLAKQNFMPKGNNRVIIATDGDFNVGVSSEGELQRLIEEKRKDGIFLSIMGFGMGNYKDNNIETLADKGNGNYAYIDNIQEARKVCVHEFGGTLFTVAKDVKLQIEFNPHYVKAYRLIGYENRSLKNEEFNDDKKDAGEIGSGHTVTAIYEIVPTGTESVYLPKTDALKYQKTASTDQGQNDEMLTLKIRYKRPDEDKSILMDFPVKNISKPFEATSENLKFAASVAEFGLLLRQSEFKGNAKYDQVIRQAKTALGKDEEGYRAEFVQLVKLTQSLDKRAETAMAEK